MPRIVSIGNQSFADIREKGCFYIDKTAFIKKWWEGCDVVTLIMRPRRFGKTLNLSMVEAFFSRKYHDRADLFQGLTIWEQPAYRLLQGTYPVISLSFASVKADNFTTAEKRINGLLAQLYRQHNYLLDSAMLDEDDKLYFRAVRNQSEGIDYATCINRLTELLSQHFQQKVILLLDEYDTPLVEAYTHGYWPQMASFMSALFNAALKSNPYLERGLMTGITRVSKESIFSDMNHLAVCTISDDEYAVDFGFTEAEVFAAMAEFAMHNRDEVKLWYDGFTIGSQVDIYNPWSIINLLDKGKIGAYWTNTSSNNLVSQLIRRSSSLVKMQFEGLLEDGFILADIDGQLVFDQLEQNEGALWSLLYTCGYLRGSALNNGTAAPEKTYKLYLTNYEVKLALEQMVSRWFGSAQSDYNGFIKALLAGDLPAMNGYINRVTLATFSSFDVGHKHSEYHEPERFYHGFVLGLIVDLRKEYSITSNRESGFGRYDIVLKPRDKGKNPAIIIEFKVYDQQDKSLENTVAKALRQIEDKRYAAELLDEGIAMTNISCYGFAFKGKTVLIGTGDK